MIRTTINYACDVEGCDSVAECKDAMAIGFRGVPKGWAMINWIAEVAPADEGKKATRFQRAFKRLQSRMPPEVAEYNEAAKELFVSDVPAQPRPVPCKAIVCDKCLDKFNLGSFDANGGGGL